MRCIARDHGVDPDVGRSVQKLATYFINSSRQRLQPVGEGEALINAIRPHAHVLGVEFLYETTALDLVTASGGAVPRW